MPGSVFSTGLRRRHGFAPARIEDRPRGKTALWRNVVECQQRARSLAQVMNEQQSKNIERRNRHGYRYDMRAAAIGFIHLRGGGRRTQATLARTEEGRYPLSPQTIVRHLRVECVAPFTEVGFTMQRFRDAAAFFRNVCRYELPFVTICNDATVLRPEVMPRLKDGALFGLGTLKAVYVPSTVAELERLVQVHHLARQVDVVLANALDPVVPSFVLGIFPQRARVDAIDIKMRWAVAADHLRAVGLHVVSTGADGDSSHLSAMKQRQSNIVNAEGRISVTANAFRAEPRERLFSMSVPYVDGSERLVSSTCYAVEVEDQQGKKHIVMVPDTHVQDPAHVGTKLRRRFTGRNGHGLRMGKHWVKRDTLLPVFEASGRVTTELALRLHKDDLDAVKDPMNFAAVWRLTDESLQRWLGQFPADDGNALAMRLYLKLMHHATRAFVDPTVGWKEAVQWAWYAFCFAKVWRRDARQQRDMKDNFLTSNQYHCIKTNAISLVLLVRWLISLRPVYGDGVLLGRHVLGSVRCERLFLTTRSSGNDRNFGVLRFIELINWAQMDVLVRAYFSDVIVPADPRKHMPLEQLHHPAQPLPADVTEAVMVQWLTEARAEAMADLALVGLSGATVSPPTAPATAAASAGAARDGDCVRDDEDDDEEDALDNVHVDDEDMEPPQHERGASYASYSHRIRYPLTAFSSESTDTFDWSTFFSLTPTRDGNVSDHPSAKLCFSGRPFCMKRPAEDVKLLLLTDAGQVVHAASACSAINNRPKVSNDRLTRVRQGEVRRRCCCCSRPTGSVACRSGLKREPKRGPTMQRSHRMVRRSRKMVRQKTQCLQSACEVPSRVFQPCI